MNRTRACRMLERGGRLGAIVAFALLAPAAGRADEALPALGSVVTGQALVQRMQVPLPAGDWVWVGRAFAQLSEMDGVAYGAIESDVLFQVKDGAATSFVMVYRNAIPVEDGWGGTEDCTKEGLDQPTDYLMSETHIFCSFIQRVHTATLATKDTDRAWKAALLFADEHHIQVPSYWYMVGFRKADRRDLLDVRYYFDASTMADPPADPPAAVNPASASPSTAPNAPAMPAAGDATGQLERWRDFMRGPVRWGFNNELPAGLSLPLPGSAEAGAQSPEVRIKLALLDDLRDKQVVSDIDYLRQRAAILATEVKLAEKKISNEELTFWKALADQISAGTANIIIDYVVLQNAFSAAGLFSVQRMFDTFQYTSHEWAWNTWGPRRLREPPPIEFPGASAPQGGGTGNKPGATGGTTALDTSN